MALMTEMILLAIFIFLIMLFRQNLVEYWNFRKKLQKLPQAPGCNFFVGHLTYVMAPRTELLNGVTRFVENSPPLCLGWLGPLPFLFVYKPQHLEPFLGNPTLTDKAFPYKFLTPWLGKGLLTGNGSFWQSHRKLLTPAFHFTILEDCLEVFAKKSLILVKKLEKETGSEGFDVLPKITRCALEIIFETAMGVELNVLEEKEESEYVESVSKISTVMIHRVKSPWLFPDFLHQFSPSGREFRKYTEIINNTSDKVIQKRKQQYINLKKDGISQENSFMRKKKKAFLDILLECSEDGEKLTHEEIRDEVKTFMFGGHDTTSIGMGWTLLMLAKHPDVQDKVYEELEKIFHGSERPPSMKDLNDMKYLERVIKESLRLYPSVPVVTRRTKKDIYLDGHLIPAGLILGITMYYTHRDPEHFPDPEKFNPDNFLPEKVATRHPFAYIPFSAGSRNCIGQKFALLEAKVILSYVLRNYKLHDVGYNPILIPEVLLKPEGGIRLRISPRNTITCESC